VPPNSERSSIAAIARASASILTLDAAIAALHLDRSSASRRLSVLVRAGWLSRVRRGVFSIRPLEAHPGTPIAEEDPWIVAMRVFDPCYIGGWSAAGHWHLTEQLFRATMVVTERHLRKSDVTIGSSDFHVARDRWRNTKRIETVWRDNARVLVASVERTIVDGCEHPDWVGGGRQLIAIFRTAVEDRLLSPDALLAGAHGARTGAALGRLAVLVERYRADASSVVAYAAKNRGAGYVRFDPAVKTNGRLNTRWGVWLNVSFADAVGMISEADILQRAREWQLTPEVVEKDNVLGWLLAGIAQHRLRRAAGCSRSKRASRSAWSRPTGSPRTSTSR
jgi:predicted transcriptional regulator of viral defense system